MRPWRARAFSASGCPHANNARPTVSRVLLMGPTLFSLPAEIVQHIVSFLSLQEVCKLGATCRHAHALTHDESFWGLQVRRQFRLFFTAEKGTVCEAWEDEDLRRPPLEGIVCDPGIQGNREVSVLYSAEFRRIMMERNKSKPDPFRVMLENSIKDMLPRLLAFYVQLPQEEQCSARLVLFGPGIESPSTRHLVHKMVNARSSTFDAVEFIKGLPGGIGSGVRINYKHMYNFDLMCLYTNSEIIRERLYLGNRAGRLDPDLNRMIVKSGCSLQLQPSILKLLPTLHCLLFAVDTAMGEGEKLKEVMDVIRRELEVVIQVNLQLLERNIFINLFSGFPTVPAVSTSCCSCLQVSETYYVMLNLLNLLT